MGQTTIEWTATYNPDGTISPGFSFNPWQGCIKVSPGCKNCYAETLSNRWGKDIWGPGAKRQRTSESYWQKPIQWNKRAKKEGRRFRVFCASMADVFEDNDQLIEWRLDLFENIIAKTPHLDWLILTKRPGIAQTFFMMRKDLLFPNIWLGVSVENQEYADERIPRLLSIPAMVRFLSCEPLLGPVSLSAYFPSSDRKGYDWSKFPDSGDGVIYPFTGVDWVIVGGESGHNARPMHPNWARQIRDNCLNARVPFFFKQHGEYIAKPQIAAFMPELDFGSGWQINPEWQPVIKGSRWGCLDIHGEYRPETTTWNGRQNNPRDNYEVTVYKVGKKAAGRLLDGQEWSQFPTVEKIPQPSLVF